MLKVFMSYASEDRGLVLPYYEKLRSAGFFPWMDSESIMPGGVWIREIEQAFLSSDVFILFMSPRSVTKRGFVQKEAREAIDKLKYSLEGDITVIPVCLEACDVPQYISKEVQYVSLQDGGWDRVLESLRLAAAQRNAATRNGITCGDFIIHEEIIKDQHDRSPRYAATISYPKFTSELHPRAAKDLSVFFAGEAISGLLNHRSICFSRMLFFDEKDWDTSSDYEKGFDIAFFNKDLISIASHVWNYYVGAAHGNSEFSCHTFLLSDSVTFLKLEDFFSGNRQALDAISAICIRELKRELWERTGSDATDDDIASFKNGAGPDWENFNHTFTVGDNEFVIRFAPYQVHCYALGSWVAEIPFYEVKQFFNQSEFAQNLLKINLQD